MKKVRISKKDPSKILKALEVQPNQKKRNSKRSSIDRQKIRSLNLKLYPSQKNETIHSHRYKLSEYQGRYTNRRFVSQRNSPTNQESLKVSFQRQKTENARKSSLNNDLHKIKYKSTEKSPYLSKTSKKQAYVESPKKNNSQSLKHVNFRSIRLSSLDNKETKQTLMKQDSETLKQAKKLMLLGELRKSILVLKTLLKKSPQNIQAMFTASQNWFKLGDIQRSISLAEKVKQLNPEYNIEVHLIIGRCYLRMKQPEISLQKLGQALKWFPYSPQIYTEKGKILVKEQKYLEAVKNFEKAFSLDPQNEEIGQKLIMANYFLQEHEKVLELVESMIEYSQFRKHGHKNKIKYLQIKAKSLFKLKKYNDIINMLKKTNESQLLYYLGYAYYKVNDYSNALISLQSSISVGENNTRIVKLLLLINIKEKDFYQAHHVLQRSKHLQVRMQEIELMKQFIEGTLMLMKRNIEEGIQILQKLKESVSKINSKEQAVVEIKKYIHTFLAYAYFSQGEFERCKLQYEIHKSKELDIDIPGVQYNTLLTKAIMCYNQKKYQTSLSLFQEAKNLLPSKLQSHFYLAICYITIYNQEDREKEEIEEERSIQSNVYLEKALQELTHTANLSHKLQNNIGASVFYHKCIFHCYLTQWKEAIICIDQAIQRSQENYWKFFYVRGLILSTIHNFMEAINDLSISINLKNTQPQVYLLRARCFQIQGQGNSAFKDLQNYIALRPKDQSIHKFAGQLLFENGAFEDAIIAFSHQQIEQMSDNYDVFLTKSKTYFLLGQFEKASSQIQIAYRLKPQNQHNIFDGKMIKVLDELTNSKPNYGQIMAKTNKIYEKLGPQVQKKRIFKQTEQFLIRAVCYFYLQNYEQAIKQLETSIKVKQKTVLKESLLQGNNRQDMRDTKSFTSQMHFNISVCYLCLGNYEKALSQLYKIQIQSDNSAYNNYIQYKNILKNEYQKKLQQPCELQVFPNRNKLSNFLPKISFKFRSISAEVKLCIPFPKVQPPEIFPNFDTELLYEFNIESVEKKPEAPWITRSENVITFTGKIEKYSRLQIQESVTSFSVKDINIDNSHIQLRSLSSRRARFIINSRTNQHQNN